MKLDAQQIIQKLRSNKKVKDYSLVISFFLVFSIFLWFAIRPNLITAFSLQQELAELREKDEHYEAVILSIVDFQSKLETNREKLYLLDEAVPPKPQVYDAINDIQEAAEESGLIVNRLELREVELLDQDIGQSSEQNSRQSRRRNREDDENLSKEYILTINSQSSQKNINAFAKELTEQRRLKLVRQLVFAPERERDVDASASALLRVEFEVRGLYL